jgi:phospholipid/cholesterol/gamma-HCH transport system substrate-binding protein
MSQFTSMLGRNRWSLIGVVAFAAGALLLTMLVAGTLVGSSGPTQNYQALFRDASGLIPGDDVRIAGVRVGKVKSVDLDGANARVTFSVARDQRVYTDSMATIEFLNLLGTRYIDLQTRTQDQALPPGSTLDLSHTREGLDLTAIFNAFRPLFDAIRPADVNELAANIVQVLQGQGPSLQHLSEQTALLTQNLVDRDQIIGSVMTNLTAVLETLNGHRKEFRSTVHELNDLTEVIADNRDEIGDTIDGLHDVVTSFASLLDDGGDSVNRDVKALAAWADSFSTVAPLIASGLLDTQELLTGYVTTLGLGSFLNTYVCESSIKVTGGPAIDLAPTDLQSKRCKG